MAGWLFQPLLPGGGQLLEPVDPDCTIDQTCPWVTQELEVSVPIVVELPDATQEPCSGRSWKLGPFIVTGAGYILQATNGQTITFGPSTSAVDGTATSVTVGDMAWLYAAGGNWFGHDYPEGSWTIT